jgi:hypothetical protein
VHTPRLATRSVIVIAVSLLLTGAAAGIAPATLAAAARTTSLSRTSLTISGTLNGVAATSARNAWAVGSAGTGPETGLQGADPALERDRVEAGAQPGPEGRGPPQRGRRLRHRCLGDRQLRHRQDPDPALERQGLEINGKRLEMTCR